MHPETSSSQADIHQDQNQNQNQHEPEPETEIELQSSGEGEAPSNQTESDACQRKGEVKVELPTPEDQRKEAERQGQAASFYPTSIPLLQVESSTPNLQSADPPDPPLLADALRSLPPLEERQAARSRPRNRSGSAASNLAFTPMTKTQSNQEPGLLGGLPLTMTKSSRSSHSNRSSASKHSKSSHSSKKKKRSRKVSSTSSGNDKMSGPLDWWKRIAGFDQNHRDENRNLADRDTSRNEGLPFSSLDINQPRVPEASHQPVAGPSSQTIEMQSIPQTLPHRPRPRQQSIQSVQSSSGPKTPTSPFGSFLLKNNSGRKASEPLRSTNQDKGKANASHVSGIKDDEIETARPTFSRKERKKILKQERKEEKTRRRADRARRRAGLLGMGIAVDDDDEMDERRKSDSSLVTVREEQMGGGISVPIARPPTPPRRLGKGNLKDGHHHHHHHLRKSVDHPSVSSLKLTPRPSKPPSSILTKGGNNEESFKPHVSSQTQFLKDLDSLPHPHAEPPAPDEGTSSALALAKVVSVSTKSRRGSLAPLIIEDPDQATAGNDLGPITGENLRAILASNPNALGSMNATLPAATAPRRLHFAPEKKKIRRRDLPQDYSAEETYRNLDDYVKSARAKRRGKMGRATRSKRRRKSSRTSSNGSSSSSSSSSSSNSSTSSSSRSSSSSDSDGGGLTLARIRAFFGDESSSSSSSDSTDSSSSTSSSSSSSTSGSSSSSSTSSSSSSSSSSGSRSTRSGSSFSSAASSSRRSNGSRSRRSRSSAGSDMSSEDGQSIIGRISGRGRGRNRHRKRRRRSQRNRRSSSRNRSGKSRASDTGGSEDERESRRSLDGGETPRRPYQTVGTTFMGSKGGYRRRRQKQQIKRARKQEKAAIKAGKVIGRRGDGMTKASRNARRKAEKARERAGGVTNYTLFTPIALGENDEKRLLGRSWNRFQVGHLSNPVNQTDPNRALNSEGEAKGQEQEKVMESLDFIKIKRRLYAYRQHLRHADGLDGDLGLGHQTQEGKKKVGSRESSNPNSKTSTPSRINQTQFETLRGAPEKKSTSAHPLSKSVRGSRDVASQFDFDNEFGDLALPPPALQLDQPSSVSSSSLQPLSNSHQAFSAPEKTLNESIRGHAKTSTISSGNSTSADVSRSAKNDSKPEKDKKTYLPPRKIKKREEKTGWRMGDIPLSPRMKETRGQRERKSSKGSNADTTASTLEEEIADLDTDLDPDDEEYFGAGFVGSPIWSGGNRFNPAAPPSFKHAHFADDESDPLRNQHGRTVDHSKASQQPPSKNERSDPSAKSGKDRSGGKGAAGGGWDPSPPPPLPLMANGNQAGGAWWLDISCPTYADMVQLSKMFPLHPLTVEDVLQQDPTEKVDVFDTLGYYFLVLRAIDERYFKYTSASASTLGLSVTGAGSKSGSGNSGSPQIGEKTDPPQIGEKTDPLFAAEEKDSLGELNSDEKRGMKHSPLIEMQNLSSGSSDQTRSGNGNVAPEKKKDSISDSHTGDGEKDSPEQSRRRDGKARVDIIEGVDGKEGIEGVSVGAVNLYLIVFAHGVISFHFEDVSKHTDRVRKKLLQLSQPVEFTSDWVAHGLLDSVVDSFSPLVEYVESEVGELERLAQQPMSDWQRGSKKKSKQKDFSNKKNLPSTSAPSIFSRFLKRSSAEPPSPSQEEVEGTAEVQSKMLKRMTNSRKIITGLSRVLAPKNDSVRGLRKRLIEARVPSLSREEVSIYMGDVHDHIITMLTLLYNSENRLSDTHHAYLALIGINNRRVKQQTDQIILLLVSVTITAVWATWFCQIWGMNVEVPTNKHKDDSRSYVYNLFGIVVAVVVTIPIIFFYYIRYLVKMAKRNRETRNAGR